MRSAYLWWRRPPAVFAPSAARPDARCAQCREYCLPEMGSVSTSTAPVLPTLRSGRVARHCQQTSDSEPGLAQQHRSGCLGQSPNTVVAALAARRWPLYSGMRSGSQHRLARSQMPCIWLSAWLCLRLRAAVITCIACSLSAASGPIVQTAYSLQVFLATTASSRVCCQVLFFRMICQLESSFYDSWLYQCGLRNTRPQASPSRGPGARRFFCTRTSCPPTSIR